MYNTLRHPYWVSNVAVKSNIRNSWKINKDNWHYKPLLSMYAIVMTTYILKTGKQTVKRWPVKTITKSRNYGNDEISPQQEQTLSILKEKVDIMFTTVNWYKFCIVLSSRNFLLQYYTLLRKDAFFTHICNLHLLHHNLSENRYQFKHRFDRNG